MKTLGIALIAIMVWGCGHSAPPPLAAPLKQSHGGLLEPGTLPAPTEEQFYEAHPELRVPDPGSMDLPVVMSETLSFEPVKPPAPKKGERAAKKDKLERANDEMMRTPKSQIVKRSLSQYPWDPTLVYEDYCRRRWRVVLLLEPDEQRTEETWSGFTEGWQDPEDIVAADHSKRVVNAVAFLALEEAGDTLVTFATNLRTISLHLVPREEGESFNLKLELPMVQEARERALATWQAKKRDDARAKERDQPSSRHTADLHLASKDFVKFVGLGDDEEVPRGKDHMPGWARGSTTESWCNGSACEAVVIFPNGLAATPMAKGSCAMNPTLERFPGERMVRMHLGCDAIYIELSLANERDQREGVTFCRADQCKGHGLL